MTTEITNAIDNLLDSGEDKVYNYRHGYVDCATDIMRVLEETLQENNHGSRELFYGRLNPKIDALIKLNALGMKTPQWSSRIAAEVKCSMCKLAKPPQKDAGEEY